MFKKILLFNDHAEVNEALQNYFDNDDFQCFVVTNYNKCIRVIHEMLFDLLILGPLTLKAHLDDVATIKTKFTNPVVGLIDHSSDINFKNGYKLGVNEFFNYPMGKNEFLSKIHKVLASPSLDIKHNEIIIPPLKIYPDAYEVYLNDDSISLTKSEFEILTLLASYPNRVFTKSDIHKHLWGEEYYEDSNPLNVHIFNLRKKIELNPSKPKIIITQRGVGYKISVNS